MSHLEPGNEKQADVPAREAPPDAIPEFYGPAKVALWLGLAAWACLAVNAALGGSAPLLLLGIAIAVAGVIVGIVAARAVGRSRGWLTGKGSAIAGICISGAHIVVMVALAAILLPALGRVRDEGRKIQCGNNLEQIGEAADLWLLKHGGQSKYPPSFKVLVHGGPSKYPPSLKALVDDDIIVEPNVFICQATGTKPVPGKFVTDYECIMDRADFPITDSMLGVDSGAVPMAWDKPGNHPDGFNVVYFDAHVTFLSDDRTGSARKKLLAEVDAWIEKNRPK